MNHPIDEEELREKLAKQLGVDAETLGGGYEYGQFWNGPFEYPIDEVLEKFGMPRPKHETIIFKAASSKEADWVLKRLQTWKGRKIKIGNLGLTQKLRNKTTIYFEIEAVE